MKTPLNSKTVEYAYPTSSNAKKFGRYDTGCWCLELASADNSRPSLAIDGYDTKEEAVLAAQALSHPWSPLFLRFNPEFAA